MENATFPVGSSDEHVIPVRPCRSESRMMEQGAKQKPSGDASRHATNVNKVAGLLDTEVSGPDKALRLNLRWQPVALRRALITQEQVGC
jgi:hypothetical protein